VDALAEAIDQMAGHTRFSGAVRVDPGFEYANGVADRIRDIPITATTRFAIASGSKAFTALAVVSLIADGMLALESTARSLLGSDLPLIPADVTIEHLLAHRSGIGDYLDESATQDANDFVLPVPAEALVETEDYLPVLDGHPMLFPAGEGFAYNNSGYVVLALVAERVSGRPFHDLVGTAVCEPAGMRDTAFLRSDSLPDTAAIGYLDVEGSRTNRDRLPVRGNGDGGIYSTVADMRAFWIALFDGRIVPRTWVSEMVSPRSETPNGSMRYGLGFWLDPANDTVVLEGNDAGVSFRSFHHVASATTATVISNVTGSAWPIARLLRDRVRA